MKAIVGTFCLFLGAAIFISCASASVAPENFEQSPRANVFVTIKNGTIRGYTARAANNNTIYTFMKIPFAKPPLGELRFKNPQPTTGWGDEILDGTQLTPACPQMLGVVNENEDCLYLNIYSSRNGSDPNLLPAPVMVYLYGGAFALGETSYYTGHRLVSNDIILVVPNYRVSVLGFLSTGDEVSPGNYGLKDQNLALRWVQENILNFGGDPTRVTIVGESAGAVSVTMHLLSPMSKGLFHRAIAQSGSALTPWAVDKRPFHSAQRIAGYINCPNDTSQHIVDCMMERPTLNLTAAYFTLFAYDLMHADMRLEGTNPVIEPDLPGAFLTEDPYKILREKRYNDVPMIFGATSDEGALFLAGFHVLGFGNHSEDTLNDTTWMREEMVNHILTMMDLRHKVGATEVEETVALTFMSDRDRLNFTAVARPMVDILSVYGIKGAVKKTADLVSENQGTVYFYSMEFVSTERRNSLWYYIFEIFAPIIGSDTPAYPHEVMHGDDLVYEFSLPFILNERDVAFSSMFCELWANFATTGNPTPKENPNYPQWPKYHWRDPKYLVLDAEPRVESDYTLQWRK